MQDCWLLLVRYLSRCEFCSQPGVPLLIDAKNERVASWYASYGAVPMEARNYPHRGSVFLEFLIREFDEIRPVWRGRMAILVLAERNVP